MQWVFALRSVWIFSKITIVLARYTRPEVLKISCKTQYFSVFHSNGHENSCIWWILWRSSQYFVKNTLFYWLILKGILTLFSMFDVFHGFPSFLNTLLCLLRRCSWCFLLNFSVFSSLLLEQYRVTNFRREKKTKMCFSCSPE